MQSRFFINAAVSIDTDLMHIYLNTYKLILCECHSTLDRLTNRTTLAMWNNQWLMMLLWVQYLEETAQILVRTPVLFHTSSPNKAVWERASEPWLLRSPCTVKKRQENHYQLCSWMTNTELKPTDSLDPHSQFISIFLQANVH